MAMDIETWKAAEAQGALNWISLLFVAPFVVHFNLKHLPLRSHLLENETFAFWSRRNIMCIME